MPREGSTETTVVARRDGRFWYEAHCVPSGVERLGWERAALSGDRSSGFSQMIAVHASRKLRLGQRDKIQFPL